MAARSARQVFEKTDGSGIADSLRAQGFALIKAEPQCAEWRTASERRFSLAPATKAALRRGPGDGYVCSGSKEMFYFGRDSDSVARSVATHVPTAACAERRGMISSGRAIMHVINTHILDRPDIEGEAEAIKGWFGEWPGRWHRPPQVCDTAHSVMTDFKYHESDEPLRAAAHIDRGLLTVISNPADIEIRMPDDSWFHPYSATEHAGLSPVLVLVGFTLERATAGVFCAALHRVHNSGGERCSTVLELRAPPALCIKPAIITRSLQLPDVDESALVPFFVADHNEQFARVHTSVNQPAPMLPVPSQGVGALAALAQQTPPADRLCSLPFDVLVHILHALPFTTLASIMRSVARPVQPRRINRGPRLL